MRRREKTSVQDAEPARLTALPRSVGGNLAAVGHRIGNVNGVAHALVAVDLPESSLLSSARAPIGAAIPQCQQLRQGPGEEDAAHG